MTSLEFSGSRGLSDFVATCKSMSSGEKLAVITISLTQCKLRDVPIHIKAFRSLENLSISFNPGIRCPAWLFEMPNLVSLDMQRCGLETLPMCVVDSPYLECLTLSENNFYPTVCNRHADTRDEVEALVQDLHAGGLLTDARDSASAAPVSSSRGRSASSSVKRSTGRSVPRDSVAVQHHRRAPAAPSSSSARGSPRGDRRRAPSVPLHPRSPVASRGITRDYASASTASTTSRPVIRATGPPPDVPASSSSRGGSDPRLERAQATISQLRNQLDETHNDYDLKEAELRDVRNQLAEKDRAVAASRREQERLKTEHQRELAEARAATAEVHRQMDALEGQLQEKDNEGRDAQNRIQTLTKLLRNKDAELQSADEDRQALNGANRELARLEGIISANEDEIHDTKNRLQSLTKLLRTKDSELVRLADDLAQSQAEVQLVIAEQKTALDAAYGELDQTKNAARDRERSGKLIHSELQKTRAFLEEKDRELQQAYADLDVKATALAQSGAELDNAYKDLDEKNRIIDKNYERIRMKEEDLKNARAEVDGLRAELANVNTGYQDKERALASARARNDEQMSRVEASRQRLQEQYDAIQQVLAEKEEEWVVAKDDHQDALIALESKIDQMGVDLMEKESQHDKAQATIEQLQVTMAERERELEAALADVSERNNVIEEKKREISSKDEEIASMGKDTDVLLDTLAEIRETLSETEEKLAVTKEQLKVKEEQYQSEAEQRQQNARALAELEEVSAEQKDKIFRLTAELTGTKAQLTETGDALNSAYDDLQKAYDDLSATQMALADKEEALDSAYADEGKTAALIRRMRQEAQVAAETHQFQLDQVRAHAEKREADLEEQLEEKIMRLKATYTDLDDKRKVISIAREEGREMEDELREQLALKDDALSQTRDELEEANETIEALRADKAEKQSALATAYAKLADAMESVDELQGDGLQNQLEELRGELTEKQQTIDRMTAEMEEKTAELAKLSEEFAALPEAPPGTDDEPAQPPEKEESSSEQHPRRRRPSRPPDLDAAPTPPTADLPAAGGRRRARSRPVKMSSLGSAPKPRSKIPTRLRAASVAKKAPLPPSHMPSPPGSSPKVSRLPPPPTKTGPKKGPPGRPAPKMEAPRPPN